jgi:hypothetical protein
MDLVKADAKIEDGWIQIPNDEHGGEQRWFEGDWCHRWPTQEKARGAAKRYELLAGKAALAQEMLDASGVACGPFMGSSPRWRFESLARSARKYAEVYFSKGGVWTSDLWKGDDPVGRKVKKLTDEGKPQKQAVAIALDMQRRGDLEKFSPTDVILSEDAKKDEDTEDEHTPGGRVLQKFSSTDTGFAKTGAAPLAKGTPGEGSRGGKVIGHTSSGRAIYGPTAGGKVHPAHGKSIGERNYTEQDHKDAIIAHMGASDQHHRAFKQLVMQGKQASPEAAQHAQARDSHFTAASNHHIELHGSRKLGVRPGAAPANKGGPSPLDLVKAAGHSLDADVVMGSVRYRQARHVEPAPMGDRRLPMVPVQPPARLRVGGDGVPAPSQARMGAQGVLTRPDSGLRGRK